MTNKYNLSKVRKFVFAPAAIVAVASAASSGYSAETRVHVRGGKMETRINNGKVTLTGLHGDVGTGRVEMAGNIAVGSGEAKNLTVNFAEVPVSDAAGLLGNARVPSWLTETLVSGTIKGEWQGEGFKEISSSAKGALHIKTGAGVITDKTILEKLADLLKVDELSEVKYDSITLKAHAVNGVFVLDEIQASGPEFNVKAIGKYTAKADALDIRIDLAVSQEIASRSTYLKLKNVFGIFGGGPEMKETADGLVEVPRLLVSGALKKPEVKLDKTKSSTPAVASTNPASRQTQQVAFGDRLKSIF